MNPITVSAQLAAFVWFTHGKTCLDGRTRSEAMRFARDNWEAFLPLAHEGLGRLLLKIARRPAPKRRRGAPSRRCFVAAFFATRSGWRVSQIGISG